MTDEPTEAPVETSDPVQDADPPVESLMGWRDFLTVAPRHRSAAVTQAAYAGMRRWMRLQGTDVDGFYAMETQWQEHYAAAMRYTG